MQVRNSESKLQEVDSHKTSHLYHLIRMLLTCLMDSFLLQQMFKKRLLLIIRMRKTLKTDYNTLGTPLVVLNMISQKKYLQMLKDITNTLAS